MNKFSKYLDIDYLTFERWTSYYFQIYNVIRSIPRENARVLEVGPGNRIVSQIIENVANAKVFSIDIDKGNHPTFVGSVTNMPFPDGDFDLVMCFQVLEHLPFDEVHIALRELARVSKSAVMISVPHGSLHCTIAIKLTGRALSSHSIAIDTRLMRYKIDEEHYWELGGRGKNGKYYKVRDFMIEVEKAGLDKTKDFRNPYFPWHHFFLLKKSKADTPSNN